jgi:hypothetical protein
MLSGDMSGVAGQAGDMLKGKLGGNLAVVREIEAGSW